MAELEQSLGRDVSSYISSFPLLLWILLLMKPNTHPATDLQALDSISQNYIWEQTMVK